MGYSTRLCNSTPFPVRWSPSPGFNVNLEPDGTMDMSVEMADAFNPNKANHPSIRELMDSYGIFVYDPDREYDVQALTSLKAYVKLLDDMYKDAKLSQEKERAKMGHSNDEDKVNEILDRLGYDQIREKIAKCKKRIEALSKVTVAEDYKPGVKTYDPTRTIFVLPTPKEFQSPNMMKLFLDENPEIAEAHAKWVAQQDQSKRKAKAAENVTTAA